MKYLLSLLLITYSFSCKSIDYSIDEISKLNDIHNNHIMLPKAVKGEYWKLASISFDENNQEELINYLKGCYLFMLRHKRIYYHGEDKDNLENCSKELINEETSYNRRIELMIIVQDLFKTGIKRL